MSEISLNRDIQSEDVRPVALILSWYGPGHRDAGEKIRLAAMAEALQQGFRLHWALIDGDDMGIHDSSTASIFPVAPASKYRMRAVDYLRAMLRLRAIEADRLAGHKAVRLWAIELIEVLNPDVIWANQPFVWGLVPRGWRRRAILDTHNVNSARLARIAQSAPHGVAALVARLQSRLTRRFERAYVREAGATVAVSQDDAALLAVVAGSGNQVAVIPNGADLLSESETKRLDGDEVPKLLFLGSLTYSANVDALRRLARWLVEADVDVAVTVAGSGASDEVRRLCERTPQLNFVGRVDDARETMAAHHALVAPHSQGGGSRIKVLEALATRLPVIGSEVAVEGLEMTPGVNYLLAESAESFRIAVHALRNRNRVGQLVEAGWLIASANQWATVGEQATALALRVGRGVNSSPSESGGVE